MREILFKAKHIHAMSTNKQLEGRWIEGYLCSEKYINSPELEGEFLIDPNTICQFTGVYDKNGNKIWENDICSVLLIHSNLEEERENCIVKYGRRAENFKIELGFNIEWTKTNYLRQDICFWIENREVEVIGNIFDNPELLGGGE